VGKDRRVLREFGSIVRRRRREKGLSQEALAELTGFDRTYISQVELGKRNPALVNVCRLAEALDTTPAELLKDLPTGGLGAELRIVR
jgi:transcriptional regulator with XRE-family HTH domain